MRRTMHALWLTSWYPRRDDPFYGDFIQRHARALALSMPVTVIHVAPGAYGPELRQDGNLTERVLYYREADTRWRLLDRLLNGLRAFGRYRRAYRAHRSAHGRPDLVHVHVCMNAGLFALWLRFRHGLPFVVTEHYSVYIPDTPDNFHSRPRLYRMINRRILRKAGAVHTVSRFLLGCMEKVARLRHPTVISNTVDTGLFHPGPSLIGDGFRFIHVSSFEEVKNVRAMLEAFALLLGRRRDWELVLVGPAGYPVQSFADAIGLTANVHWTGEVPYASVATWMQRSQALVLFSQFETQSCVALEALCCGIPVVSSAVGGITEVLHEGNALLVPADDKKALEAALFDMMEGYDRFDRPRIASEAAARYALPVIGRALEAFYASSATHTPSK